MVQLSVKHADLLIAAAELAGMTLPHDDSDTTRSPR
jgi:hypothetical protein